MRFAIRYDKKTKEKPDVAGEILDIYILNLLAALAMFAVLLFRAWLELRNYRLMWKELD
jgi:hypothetical protein